MQYCLVRLRALDIVVFLSHVSYFSHNWCDLAHETARDKVADNKVVLGEYIIGRQYHDL